MERIQGHLCGWFTQTLSRNTTNHLARVDYCAPKYLTDRLYQLVKRPLVQTILHHNFLGAEIPAQENLKEHNRIVMSLLNQVIVLDIHSCLRDHNQTVH